MIYNKNKITIIDFINKTIGLLITLRTVETTPLNTKHWVNQYIEILSELRNKIHDDFDLCTDCNGSGSWCFTHIEDEAQTEPCKSCEGLGFVSKNEIIQILTEIHRILIKNKNTRVASEIADFLTSPLLA